MKDLRSLFLNEKPASAMVTLKQHQELHIRKISSEIDATYSHTLRLLDRMEENGVVESREKGRRREYWLTARGEKLADNFSDFFGPGFNGQDYSSVIGSKTESTLGGEV